jgi:hypothetical protein
MCGFGGNDMSAQPKDQQQQQNDPKKKSPFEREGEEGEQPGQVQPPGQGQRRDEKRDR